MKISVSQRTKWRGGDCIVPAFGGTLGTQDSPGGNLAGLKVGELGGDVTTLRSNGALTAVISMGAKGKRTADTLRRAGGHAAKWLAARKLTKVAVDPQACGGFAPAEAEAFCEGLMLGAFRFEQYKSKSKRRPVASVQLLVTGNAKAITQCVRQAAMASAGVNLCRELSHQPPNVINPVSLAKRAKAMCSSNGLKCTVLDEKQMARLKMGGILSVGKSSDTPPRLIVIKHAGKGKGKPVVLVGKAVTFDTGGYSIKPKDGILGMKYDKCGGMAVMGVMQAVAAMKLPVPVIGIISAAENMISGGAYRPDDIITTMAGKTVEIVSTDAEGRMVLCDAMTYAQRQFKPRAMIDLATLTGGVVISLGHTRGGIFCNDPKLRDSLVDAGERTFERLWELPMDDEYLELLSSPDADFKNSSTREAHAIQGAIFLKQFVEPKTAWAHLDIAGVATIDSAGAYCPQGATGFGVRLLLDYLQRLRA